MAKDAILAVKKAEEEANQLVEDAKITSRKLQDESIKAAEEEYNKIILEGKQESQSIKEKAKEEGEALARPILDEGQKKAKDLENFDPNRKDKAVNFIIERIVKDKWL